MPLRHTPLWQSLPTKHPARSAHLPHEPPQSVSVSLPFRTRSLQVGAWHLVAVQTSLAQSEGPRQFLPGGQPVHEPPQSWSDSEPFVAPSLHVAEAQIPFALQKFVAQSEALPQLCPAAHLPHVGPPQSMALSFPLRSPSVQVAARQVPAVQTRL